MQGKHTGEMHCSLLLKFLRKYTGVECCVLMSLQSVHQLPVGFSLLFQAVMFFHVQFSIPHHSLSQLMI